MEVFHALLGGLDCRAGRFDTGIAHFRSALAIRSGDVAVRCQLVQALIDQGDPVEALQCCPEDLCRADSSLRLMRLRAFLLQLTQSHAEAAALYGIIVAKVAGDAESWNNLGNALAATGDFEGALAAIEQSIRLQPGNGPARFNQSVTLIQLARFDAAEAVLSGLCRDMPAEPRARVELAALCKLRGRDPEALAWLEEAARIAPQDATLQVKLGLERQFAWQMDGAIAAFREAARLDPALDEAHVLLALQLEHLNRPGAIATVAADARAGGASSGVEAFLRALLCRRDGRFEAGLGELDKVPSKLEPIRVAQMRGQCHDRLGHAAEAIAAFGEMNRLQQHDSSEPLRRAREYREALVRDRALVTCDWYASWRRDPLPCDDSSPVFLLGFPRSGTTLLDTMLMGHPQMQVLEERPALARVEREIGGIEALPALSGTDIIFMRELYFEEAGRWITRRPGALLVDKLPLHLNKVPIIHRLFPDARFILALRHPLDVLLSCYITNFRLNSAMANFLDLETAAWLYDQSFGFWEQCRQLMGITSRAVVYERVVEDSDNELRALCAWLGLEWDAAVLDHQRSAARRGVITTASYAQVTEPLYTRARGRWERYRPWLEAVLPVVQPWIERYGYRV